MTLNAQPSTLNIPSFPARPMNGGDLTLARPKIGRWFVEPKYNGWRALVHVPTGSMWNRQGKRLTIEKEFAKALAILRETSEEICKIEWLDCEALERRHGIGRGTLIVLDSLDDAALSHETRRELMRDIFDLIEPSEQPNYDSVYLTPNFAPEIADPLWKELQALNKQWNTTGLHEFYEGIVMKRADSLYPMQLRGYNIETPHWIKHRWTPN